MSKKADKLLALRVEEPATEPKPQDDGSWVMLTKHLPINPALVPPLLSIHWTIAWPQWAYAKCQEDRLKHYKLQTDESLKLLHSFADELHMGFEPIWAEARRIMFKGEAIRILPHEFSLLSTEHMQLYLLGDASDDLEPPYELVLADTASDERIGTEIKSGRQRTLYEHALIDGCDHDLAVLMALGLDVTAQVEFPALGWYRLKPGYAEALGVA